MQFMYERLVLLQELLSETGSLYLHVDTAQAHYLKVLCDEVFGRENFQREIVWRIGWVSGYKSQAKNWIRNHDTILFYSKDPAQFYFDKQYAPYAAGYKRRGEGKKGKGHPLEDTWNCSEQDKLDSIQIKSFSHEKTGYPTQKNEQLLERIIRSSCPEGGLVLDCLSWQRHYCCGGPKNEPEMAGRRRESRRGPHFTSAPLGRGPRAALQRLCHLRFRAPCGKACS
jgi:adenine-specific DNA-methyltransferase